MKSKKLFKIALIALALIIVFLLIARKAGWIGAMEGARVTVEEASLRNIVEVVTASGKIQPVTEVKISPDVSGEIIELPILEGDYVERGQLLARINPDMYVSARDRMEAALNTSRANLATSRARSAQAEAQFINAEASYLRSRKLFQEQAISASEYDAARANYLVSQAEVEAAKQSVVSAEYQVKSAEAGLKEARESLQKTSLFSPMDGTISRLDAEIGERVVGTSQFAGTEIMRIANLNQMEVLVEVNENDIVRVNEGDTARIEVDAYFTERFTGVVTSIANSAKVQGQSVDQVTNFEVRIRILPSSYTHLQREDRPYSSPFRPGMSATVDILTRRVSQVVTVPIQAVTTREPDSKPGQEEGEEEEETRDRLMSLPKEYVFVYEEEKAILREVTTGIQDTYYIEILTGLEEGEKIITGPYRLVSRQLKDGDAVTRSKKEEIFGN
jgi:HlyD family secretion protein